VIKIEKFKLKSVLIYCEDGSISIKAVNILKQRGFIDVSILDGGMQSYQRIDYLNNQNIDEKKIYGQINKKINQGKPVFLFFYVDWCGYCNRQKPIISELKQTFESKIDIIRINAEEFSSITEDFSVVSYPQMFLIIDQIDGEYIYYQFRGLTDKNTLTNIFENIEVLEDSSQEITEQDCWDMICDEGGHPECCEYGPLPAICFDLLDDCMNNDPDPDPYPGLNPCVNQTENINECFQCCIDAGGTQEEIMDCLNDCASVHPPNCQNTSCCQNRVPGPGQGGTLMQCQDCCGEINDLQEHFNCILMCLGRGYPVPPQLPSISPLPPGSVPNYAPILDPCQACLDGCGPDPGYGGIGRAAWLACVELCRLWAC